MAASSDDESCRESPGSCGTAGSGASPCPLNVRGVASRASALALMERHVEALYTHDARGRILHVREHDGAPAPRFFLGRTVEGAVRRYRRDVDDVLRRELEAAFADDVLPDDARGAGAAAELARYAVILGRAASVEQTWIGPAFSFPDALPAPHATSESTVVRVTRGERGAPVAVAPGLDARRAPVAAADGGRCRRPGRGGVRERAHDSARARSRRRDGARIPRPRLRPAGRGGVGPRGARDWRRAALQHVVAERGVAVGGAEARADPVRARSARHLTATARAARAMLRRASLLRAAYLFYKMVLMQAPTLGTLELSALLAVARLGEDAYGLAVRRDLSQRTGRDHSVGAVYTTLQRLEDKGLLTSRASEPLPVRGGRRDAISPSPAPARRRCATPNGTRPRCGPASAPCSARGPRDRPRAEPRPRAGTASLARAPAGAARAACRAPPAARGFAARGGAAAPRLRCRSRVRRCRAR